ncbi:MAG TPA: hypothetical protein VIQ51_16160, partial [Chryseosolibacter sp.]
ELNEFGNFVSPELGGTDIYPGRGIPWRQSIRFLTIINKKVASEIKKGLLNNLQGPFGLQ